MLTLLRKLLTKKNIILIRSIQIARIFWYKTISPNRKACSNYARFTQPTLFVGNGHINVGRCHLGVWPSPLYLSHYIHLEARHTGASITIHDGAQINNGVAIIAESSSISIGKNALIGPEVVVFDSDFHQIPRETISNHPNNPTDVSIGDNVFVGARAMILKGVTIGNNSVIASGSVVTKSIPPNVIAGGIPAKVIRALEHSNDRSS